MRQEVLAGPERRRRWSEGEKIAIVREASDASIAPAVLTALIRAAEAA